jgi:hypothetical protein
VPLRWRWPGSTTPRVALACGGSTEDPLQSLLQERTAGAVPCLVSQAFRVDGQVGIQGPASVLARINPSGAGPPLAGWEAGARVTTARPWAAWRRFGPGPSLAAGRQWSLRFLGSHR